MNERMKSLSHIAPVFRVKDLARSLAFYRRQLRFDLEFLYENFYGSIVRDGCHIHLQCAPPVQRDQADFERHEHLDACLPNLSIRSGQTRERARPRIPEPDGSRSASGGPYDIFRRGMTIDDGVRLLEAATKLFGVLVWPAVPVFVLVRFGQALCDFVASLGEFSLKGAGFEASAKRMQVEAAVALTAAAVSRPGAGATPENAAREARAAHPRLDLAVPSTDTLAYLQ